MNWDISPAEAISLQKTLRSKIKIHALKKQPRLIAGADVSFQRFSPDFYAGIVVFEYPSLKIVDRSWAYQKVKFPYVPGLLSFREIPVIEKAFKKLKHKPDLMIFDGQGYAHPRRLGVATHAGIHLNIPTIGCAKSRLCGEYRIPGLKKGSRSMLKEKGEHVGWVLRTKDNVKEIFISPGHLVDFKDTLKIIKRVTGPHRVPIPTREAHIYTNEIRKNFRR